jgi:hypothetical protein
MAKQSRNIVTQGTSGKLGNLVFRQVDGETVISVAPRKRKVTTEPQKEQMSKFQRATLYAKMVLADPETAAEYGKAAKKGLNAYNVAVADFFHAPDIHNIDVSGYHGQPGDSIVILAHDDFKVKEVSVSITKADGTLVEEGYATPDPTGYKWTYTASETNNDMDDNRIEVVASDMPGNVTRDGVEI